MQMERYSASLHHNLYPSSQNMHSPMPEQYLAPGGGANLIGGFSRGSLSYPHADYRYFPDRGTSAGLSSTSLGGPSHHATAMAFPGSAPNGSDIFRPEEITEYEQPWHWGDASAQRVQISLPSAPDPNLRIATSSADYKSVVRAPAAQRPTPAAMAVLLNPSGRSDIEASGGAYEAPPAVQPTAQFSATRPAQSGESAMRLPGVPDNLSREKKHGCTMCHKRFDRPSTLRKHLLVHTGEKAFVCETCGRRFGVASNLNRHVRKCILKPVNSPSASSNKSASGSPPAAAPSPDCLEASDPHRSHDKRAPSSASTSPALASSNDVQSQTSRGEAPAKSRQPTQKRRRRAPSPSKWIPYSLLPFNLISEEFHSAAPVPLLPVRRNLPKEERDSWNENVGSAPYHPCGWKGVLPGPGLGLGLGLGGKDVRNLNMNSSSGFMLGRVLVF